MIRLMLVVAILSLSGPALAQDATPQHGGMQHMPGMSLEGHGMNSDAVPAGLMEGGVNRGLDETAVQQETVRRRH